MALKTLEITITQIKRVWCDVTVHGMTDYKTRVKKDAVEKLGLPVGERVSAKGYVKKEYSRYGSTSELILSSDDTYKDEQVQRWIGYFREKAEKQHYFYERAVDEIHSLGCKDYDEEFANTKYRLITDKWIGYFRSSYDNGSGHIYDRAIKELHFVGCHEYDNEIDEAKAAIEKRKAQQRAEKAQQRAEKREKERLDRITTLALPAHDGFGGRPRTGEVIEHKGKAYEVISSYYHDSDGWSFGAMCEEWYSIKAKDVSDTPKGLALLQSIEAEKEKARKERAYRKAVSDLEGAVRSKGQLYRPGGKIALGDIPGADVVDTFNIYGGGIIIRMTDTEIYCITNNGADGDDWSLNNIRTGGAGAYCFTCNRSDVEESIRNLVNTIKEKENDV